MPRRGSHIAGDARLGRVYADAGLMLPRKLRSTGLFSLIARQADATKRLLGEIGMLNWRFESSHHGGWPYCFENVMCAASDCHGSLSPQWR